MTDGIWNFYFEAPIGTRILRSRFYGITNFEENLWWSYEHKKWLPLEECGTKGISSTLHCRSFKAFKSHLRRHPELQTAKTVVLVSRFVGHNITAIWFKELKVRTVGRFVLNGRLRGVTPRMVVIDDPHRYLSNSVGSAGL